MRVTEKKRIKVKSGCVDNPVYLRWVNQFGGYNYWLFGKRQVEETKPENDHVITRTVGKVSSTRSVQEVIRKTVERTMTVGAVGLTKNDLNGIMSIVRSIKVEMLMNHSAWSQGSVPIWKTVIVKPDSIVIDDNSASVYSIELNIVTDRYMMQRQ